MLKSRALTLAVLATVAAGAHAQSNVTIYGKFDIGFRKAIGTDNKELATSGDSRLGFRGTEDLGGGRTLIYTDVGHDSKASTAKTGYDLGIRHTF